MLDFDESLNSSSDDDDYNIDLPAGEDILQPDPWVNYHPIDDETITSID